MRGRCTTMKRNRKEEEEGREAQGEMIHIACRFDSHFLLCQGRTKLNDL